MYAVITTGGKQVKVTQGDVIRVERLPVNVGDTIELDRVNALANDEGITVDAEALAGAKVVCRVTGEGRRKKIRVFKMKRRKNYSRSYGHRQDYTELKVQEIQG